MRTGKIPQAVLDRSVLRVINHRNDAVILDGRIGGDASLLKAEQSGVIAVDTRTVCGTDIDKIKREITHLINHIACGGSLPDGIMLSIVFPENEEEEVLKDIMKAIEESCSYYDMQIVGGHTTVSCEISVPVVTITALGLKSVLKDVKRAEANQDIVMTRWIALEGTAIAAAKYYDELSKKLPKNIIDKACEFNKLTDSSNDAIEAYNAGARAIHDVGEGGVFASLWEFAYASGVGIEVDIKKIPIKQETVEVCELLQVNPYEFLSVGSLIIATDNGEDLCGKLNEKGIEATVVGHTTDKNDRVLINEDEIRHLSVAQQDYIYKI